ncbi:hypothetical protein [Burkholderia phage BCSR129]|nr:hypothetical protein [Burkholderia phage BCSR129]
MTTINESQLAKAFRAAFGIDPLNSEGVFNIREVINFAADIGVNVCEDISRANPGKMPTREHRKVMESFARTWVPTAIKLITEPSKVEKLLEEVGIGEVGVLPKEVTYNKVEVQHESGRMSVDVETGKVTGAISVGCMVVATILGMYTMIGTVNKLEYAPHVTTTPPYMLTVELPNGAVYYVSPGDIVAVMIPGNRWIRFDASEFNALVARGPSEQDVVEVEKESPISRWLAVQKYDDIPADEIKITERVDRHTVVGAKTSIVVTCDSLQIEECEPVQQHRSAHKTRQVALSRAQSRYRDSQKFGKVRDLVRRAAEIVFRGLHADRVYGVWKHQKIAEKLADRSASYVLYQWTGKNQLGTFFQTTLADMLRHKPGTEPVGRDIALVLTNIINSEIREGK